MTQRQNTTKLLLTVSGGLEDLAEQQIRSLLLRAQRGLDADDGNHDKDSSRARLEFNLEWHRGPSGSQLYLTLLPLPLSGGKNEAYQLAERTITNLIQRMDFVDYVFILLDSFELRDQLLPPTCKDGDGKSSGVTNQQSLLRQVETASQNIDPQAIAFCERICNELLVHEDDPKDDTIGLESVAGVLLPPLEIEGADIDSKESPLPTRKDNSCHQETTNVNTIYTKDAVAKAVVERVREFCNQQHQRHPNTSNGNPQPAPTLWIDAGSGNGALLRHLPVEYSIGIDTNPTSSSTAIAHRVLQMDFLETSKGWIEQQQQQLTSGSASQQLPPHNLCVVSNPPFSSSTRGDYTPIVQFINHSLEALGATHVAVICPTKFAKPRIWRTLGMSPLATLQGRFVLPQNSFLHPSTKASVNIQSCCLVFGNANHYRFEQQDANQRVAPPQKSGVYLSSKRDKKLFPNLSTAAVTAAMASGLAATQLLQLAHERTARHMLQGRLTDPRALEFWWQANPRRPCSVANATCRRVSDHSLGSLSLSCNPPVALAMTTVALQTQKGNHEKEGSEGRDAAVAWNRGSCVVVNLMSGEGTIELESNRAAAASNCFWIGGDKSFERARRTARRLRSLRGTTAAARIDGGRRRPVDMVVWDAQNLPLRKGFADALLADLPFQGSLKKTHREPTVGGGHPPLSAPPLDYSRVLRHACRVLRPRGRAVLLSPDVKALKHAAGKFHWSSEPWCRNSSSKSINLGGLSGKLFLMERPEGCTKDVSLWVPSSSSADGDWSSWILGLANEACGKDTGTVVTSVRLHSTYYHEEKQKFSHCYRMLFDDEIKNTRAKEYEQQIRRFLEKNLEEGMSLR